MRFALLGDQRDGLDFATALAASGRHELAIYSGPAAGLAHLQRLNLQPRSIADLEEVLADPALDAVIVASGPALRPGQLRRALQSECHVVCVHPADPSPDIAYEAALIQGDTGRLLLPLLPMTLHPALARAAAAVRAQRPRVVELEVWSVEDAVLDAELKLALPGWDALRLVAGEIGEVYLQAPEPELQPGQALLASGRFVNGILLQCTYLSGQAESRWRLSLVTTTGRATLVFPQGFPGPAEWTFTTDAGEVRTESYPPFDPWAALLERFESAVRQASIRKPNPGRAADECLTKSPPVLGWQDELRALELDDAARRSAERGRASTLDLQETTEEASFKGTMTLVGCSLIWLTVAVLILSIWVHQLAWLVVPLFAIFLTLQVLRWIVPKPIIHEGHEGHEESGK
jgi:predicted dehydrogenase